MARWEFTLPDIGEGVTEGEIVGWLVKRGDSVREDQPVVEVMTDKATVTITAPKAGTVLETRGKIGEIVPVHSVLVVFELGGPGAHGAAPSRPAVENGHGNAGDGSAATAVGILEETLPGVGQSSGGASRDYYSDKPLATPATRKLARDASVDLRIVPPTGPQGRVTRQDVESFLRARPAASPAAAPAPAVRGAADPPREQRIPFAGLRRKIAQKMSQSKATAAHFTFVEECDVTELRRMRERLFSPAEALGVKLSFLPFVVKAVVASLEKHPMLGSTLDEAKGEIVLARRRHIGIATATPAGLIVPVVKDANDKSLLGVAREIERLAREARAGTLKLDDLHGSIFTITSLGAQGGLFATPIINFPEVAILGVHQMKQRPVVRDGQIVIGEVMMLSLSFDHRIVDGHVGAAFAYEVIGYLEHPERLLLEAGESKDTA